jgi:hypothetical protein
VTFLVWRQYRVQWAIALALLAAFAAVMIVTGLQVASQWHSMLDVCSRNGAGNPCGSRSLGAGLGNDLGILSVIVPGVLGFLWGAPLVAHEIETGTTIFAWLQSVTRTRWLAIKAGCLLLAAATWGGAVSALVTWWSGPVNASSGEAFQTRFFDTQGIVPIGYAVFATALGITAGVLLRRTLPAIAVTLGVFIGVRLFVDDVIRQHLMPAVTVYTSSSQWSPPGAAWVLRTTAAQIPIPCGPRSAGATGPGNGSGHCLEGLGQFITYQPGSHYWPVQAIETGLYLALAAALLTVAFYVVRRRDA